MTITSENTGSLAAAIHDPDDTLPVSAGHLARLYEYRNQAITLQAQLDQIDAAFARHDAQGGLSCSGTLAAIRHIAGGTAYSVMEVEL